MLELQWKSEAGSASNRVFLLDKVDPVWPDFLSEQEKAFALQQWENKSTLIHLNRHPQHLFLVLAEQMDDESKGLEQFRKLGNQCHGMWNKLALTEVSVTTSFFDSNYLLAFAEGVALSHYQFLKYFEKQADKRFSLQQLVLVDARLSAAAVEELSNLVQAVFHARRLIDEPLSYLTAGKLAEEIIELSNQAGFRAEVFDKARIEQEGFGGLLAVNRGSIDPPSFSVLEWKPENPMNSKPIVFVGKGIVYDTGGLSLKPTGNSMDYMKSDMSGAAAVIGLFYAAAKNNLPLHLIGLVPATDNRPGLNAYTPGDVIKMHSGLQVEVLNTDAEGRMILADALSYAKRYEPELVVDLATLTGAAVVAVGTEAIAAMRTAGDDAFYKLMKAGKHVYERLVEFPLWDEYGEQIKSEVADIKNVGGRDAGSITAGKFLEHFTAYPWIHLDIAGPAFLHKKDSYRGQGGVGVGTRLLYQFLKMY